jgi:hypothetical protein
MEDMDKLYQDYVDFVSDEWEFGNINEIYEDGFTVIQSQTEQNVNYRVLTMEEFVDRKIYEKNNHFKG